MRPSLRRRRLIGALCAAGFAPRAVAQAAARQRVIGLITGGSFGAYLAPVLAKLGWTEGGNFRFLVRRVDAATPLAAVDEAAVDLARSKPDLLIATGARPVLALSRATRSIPIICGGISDPVGEGIARSLQRPGLNVTGLSFGLREAAVLQLGTMRALIPGLKRVIFATPETDIRDRPAPAHEEAARQFGLTSELAKVPDVGAVMALMGTLRDGDALWLGNMGQDAPVDVVASEAARRKLPVHGMRTDDVRAGLLLSYWLAHSDPLGRIASLADKVLRGADPGSIPFELPDKTEFAFNRATARTLGLRVPDDILVRATEVFG